MAGLSDIIQQARLGAQLQVRGVENQVKQGVQGAISNAKNQVVTGSTQVVGAVVNGGIQSVIGAAGKLFQGDISGAGEVLVNGGSNIVDRIESITGLNLSGTLGLGDGLSSSSSPNNGIDPGNPYAGINARPDPVMAFDWYTELPIIQPAVGSPMSLPWYYVEEANLPTRQFGVRSIFREGRDRHYPDKYSVDALRLSIYADNSNVALQYIEAWKGLIINPTTTQNAYLYGGGYGQRSKYSRSIKSFILSANKTTLVEFEYIECWPTGIEPVNLQSNGSDRVVWHVAFSVGDVFAKIYDVSNALNTGFMGDENPFGQTVQQAVGTVYSKLSSSVVNTARNIGNDIISRVF